MLSLFAQVQPPTQGPLENLFETVTSIFSRGDTLAHPGALIESLQAMSVVWAIVFLIVGVLCMLSGYKFYRVVTVLLALAIGLFAGYYLGKKIHAECNPRSAKTRRDYTGMGNEGWTRASRHRA